MKITRKGAITLLNACFQIDYITIFSNGGPKQSEQNFFIVRLQLFEAIYLQYNAKIWHSFCADPVKFDKNYKNIDQFKASTSDALLDFFKKDSAIISSNDRYKNIFPTIGPFDDFWKLCCTIAKIPIKKRETPNYFYAKVDAFIYFNALYQFYGEYSSDLEKDLLNAGIEIYSLEEILDLMNTENSSKFLGYLEKGIESVFIKCPLFTKIIGNYIDLSNFSFVAKMHFVSDIYSTMLFNPTTSIVQYIITTILNEQSKAIKVIKSDKDFWGNDWPNEDTENSIISDEEISRISNKIIENTKSGITNLLRNKESFNKLPQIPAFEDAVKGGYFAEQDQEGHYRSIKSLSLCFDNNPKLIALSPKTLKEYIRKSDGNTYTGATIEGYLFRKKNMIKTCIF